VDFLHNTIPMIIRARLLAYTNYSEIGYTHKLDRTIVTVGAPSMLAISTSPASTGASSSTQASPGSTAPAVEEGSGLHSAVDDRSLSTIAARCAVTGTVASVVGPGLRLLSLAPPTVSQVSSSPWSTGLDDGISCDNSRFNCQHIVLYGK
jgi:hypothetical protein